MKIILSPSKTQTPHTNSHFQNKDLLFVKEHKKILAALRKLKKTDIKKIMKLSDQLLDQTYKNIKSYNTLDEFQAFDAFTGLVFFNMDKDNYKEEEHKYIEEHVRILDAFYGILEPGTLIKPYRLDMKMNIGFNLYKFWNISEYFEDDLIINLASNEFSKMVTSPNIINISFLQNKDGIYKNQATYSKMARGLMVDYMVKNKINDIESLKTFHLDGYSFSEERSTKNTLTFIR